jgi:hypothetical protein
MRFIFITAVAVQLACAGARGDRAPAPTSAPPPTPLAPAPVLPDPAAVNPTGVAVKAFTDRVNEYLALRGKVDNGIPKLTETSDPKKIADRERALGEALVKARVNAKPGDIFVPEFQAVLIKTINDDFAKRTLAERKALVVELPKGLAFGINQIYPTTIPLATFPPNLLTALPDLAEDDVEYRIVYRHLILRDVRGNYVIDMIRDVFPIPR